MKYVWEDADTEIINRNKSKVIKGIKRSITQYFVILVICIAAWIILVWNDNLDVKISENKLELSSVIYGIIVPIFIIGYNFCTLTRKLISLVFVKKGKMLKLETEFIGFSRVKNSPLKIGVYINKKNKLVEKYYEISNLSYIATKKGSHIILLKTKADKIVFMTTRYIMRT